MKQTKKGFTLVELLVVIAILAILATVSVVGYTSFIMKANLSNDQAFVAQANITLQAGAIPNGFNSASEAINELNRNGFAGKYNTYSSGYHYAYSLANNKMYLVNDKNEVVYPEVVDISTLWGLYNDNRTSYVQGITNYVAIANITNGVHFNDVFANETTYTIDLNGCFIDVDATNAQNITATNGIIINGATAGEGADTDYVRAEAGSKNKFDVDAIKALADVASGEVVVKDTIFTEQIDAYIKENVKFEHCVFYGNASVQIGGTNSNVGNVTIENCQFINIESWAITLYSNEKLSVKDCTFTGLTKGAFNIVPSAQNVEIEIIGCTFDGTTKESNILIRFVSLADGSVASFTMTDCTFLGLGKAVSILGYRPDDVTGETNATVTAGTTWAFSNNKVASSITTDMYIGEVSTATQGLYDAFVAGIK